MTFRTGLFVLLFLASCKTGYRVNDTSVKIYAINSDSLSVDSSIINLISPYKTKLDGIMNEVLGINAQVLIKERPESNLGNFMVDACLIETKNKIKSQSNGNIDFCFLNYGGIRKTSLHSGEITTGDIFELMPFENEMVILSLNGNQMQQLLEYFGTKGDNPVSGITLKIHDKKIKEVLISGKPFDENKTYRVATSDYLANGGDQLSFLAQVTARENTGLKIRDILITYIKALNSSGKKITAQKEGRIVYE